MTRAFIGTYRCMSCGCRVRVYDWLPAMLLCAKCGREEHRREQKEQEEET